MEKFLLLIGVSIFGILGTLHLLFTFFTSKFTPFNPDVKNAMLTTSPRLTKETSMWHAWIGFNASHSLGAMLLPAIYIPLCINHFSIVSGSVWFSTLPVLIGSSYMLLAKKYWFTIPFVGILISLSCFVVAAWLLNT